MSAATTEEIKESNLRLESKAIVLVGHGGYDKIKIQQKERPRPGQGEVLVNVKATGINFAELMARQGEHLPVEFIYCWL